MDEMLQRSDEELKRILNSNRNEKLEDIKLEIPSVVHYGFEYEVWSGYNGIDRTYFIKQK